MLKNRHGSRRRIYDLKDIVGEKWVLDGRPSSQDKIKHTKNEMTITTTTIQVLTRCIVLSCGHVWSPIIEIKRKKKARCRTCESEEYRKSGEYREKMKKHQTQVRGVLEKLKKVKR